MALPVAPASVVPAAVASFFDDIETTAAAHAAAIAAGTQYQPGGTDVAVADGGTGASTAAAARTNLGLVIGTDVAAQSSLDQFDWKASCRVCATTNVVIASALENGDTVDGVVLSTGDRVLLTGQTAGAENGIYVAVASGAASRATDASVSAEVTAGMAVAVTEGTSNGDAIWLLTTNDPITLDTTALVFTKIGAGGYTPGGTDVAVADGGTGSSTASGARTNLGLVIGTDVAAIASPAFTGLPTGPQWKSTGVTGANTTPLTLSGANASGAPASGTHVKGQIAGDDTGKLWYCTVAGTPGTWVDVGGTGGAIRVEDEGSSIVAAATGINFAGAGVTVTDAGSNEALVTIPGGSGGMPYKRTYLKHSSNITTTSATFVDIDATNLPALGLTLAVGDVVELILAIGACTNAGGAGHQIKFDWLIDRPTSADTTIRDIMGSDAAAVMSQESATGQNVVHIRAHFTCTEAGAHTFKPQWRAQAGTAQITMSDANYDAPVLHEIINRGAPTA